ncbi:MAG: sigma-70 family RNA polymerase sigma factor [Acidobacteriota bacterium]|nr:sigma-70 family RNA polymerase sigma factor [Acidobacteriota bacterium]
MQGGRFLVDENDSGNVKDAEAMHLVSSAAPSEPQEPLASADAPAVERALARRAASGDSDAFAELVARRTPGVLAFLRRLLGDAEDARDVAQLTFVRVWENLDRYDPAWAFSTWLFRIAGNLAIDALRARGTRQRTEAESFRLVKGGRTSADPDGPALLAEGEVRRVFESCAGVLSEKQRLVFVLREFEDKESREIAQILGCRESTVRNHLFQARRLLRDEIRKRFPEFVAGR